MRFKNPEFIVPRARLQDFMVFANTRKLGRLFAQAPDIQSETLSARDFERLHASAVANLNSIVEGLPLPSPKRLVDQYKCLTMHGHDFDYAAAQFTFRYEFPTLEAQVSFLTLLLLAYAKKPGFPGDLSRCHFGECRDFFFATELKSEGRGPKPRKYCSDEHREAASISTPRVKKHRGKSESQ